MISLFFKPRSTILNQVVSNVLIQMSFWVLCAFLFVCLNGKTVLASALRQLPEAGKKNKEIGGKVLGEESLEPGSSVASDSPYLVI